MQSKPVQYRSLAFLGHPLYEVGDDGSVWSLHHGKRKPLVLLSADPYLYVRFSEKNKQKVFTVGELVLLAFVGPRPPRHEVCHFPDKDGKNNRLSNLMWGTHSQNMRQVKLQGGRLGLFGEKHPRARLTEKDVRFIRRRPESVIKMAERFKVHRNQIYSVLWKTSWRDV